MICFNEIDLYIGVPSIFIGFILVLLKFYLRIRELEKEQKE
jgi:hypothetical protein